MAEENNPIDPPEPLEPQDPPVDPEPEEPPADPEPPAPQGDPKPHGSGGVDWKAESRKWESRAKAATAEATTAAAEAAAAAARAAEEIAARDAQIAHMQEVVAVAQEKGVPASLLKGESREELEASAGELIAFAGSLKRGFPLDTGGAAGGNPAPIDPNTIKDPRERIRARTELIQAQMN